MEFKEYQKLTNTTAIYKTGVENYVKSLEIPNEEKAKELYTFLCAVYSILGLANEAGEVAGKLKKIIRDKDCKIGFFDRNDIAEEIGDTFWYQGQTMETLGILGDKVLESNIEKLQSRQERGVLKGSGDSR